MTISHFRITAFENAIFHIYQYQKYEITPLTYTFLYSYQHVLSPTITVIHILDQKILSFTTLFVNVDTHTDGRLNISRMVVHLPPRRIATDRCVVSGSATFLVVIANPTSRHTTSTPSTMCR